MKEENNDTGNKKIAGERVSVLRIVGFTALALILILAIAFVVSDVAGPGAGAKNGGASEDLFYAVSPDNVVSMEKYDKEGLVVLTDTTVKYFDVYGNQIAGNEHTYSNPVMKAAGKNILLFDRGSYSLRVEKNGSDFSEHTFDSVVTCGDVCKKGNYAYVLNADGGYQSHLYVYNYRREKLFEWGCSADYIVDVALSENGRNVCAAVLGADNAECFSEIILFGVNSDEAAYNVKLPGVAVYSVVFAAPKKVAAYTDHGVYLFDQDGDYQIIQDYTSTEMKFSSALTGELGATAINQFGDEKNVLITVFSKNYKVIYNREYEQSVKFIDASHEYCAAVFSDHVEVINSENSLVGDFATEDLCFGCRVAGRNVYLLTSEGILQFGAQTKSAR